MEIVENGHTELLELPLMQELVQRKWDCYGAKLYYDRLHQVIGFMLTTTFVHVTPYAERRRGDKRDALGRRAHRENGDSFRGARTARPRVHSSPERRERGERGVLRLVSRPPRARIVQFPM